MANLDHLAYWNALPKNTKTNIFRDISSKKGLPDYAIEKDWWIVHSLSLVFSLSFADALVFKGGTSLSKGWNLIDRLSEDIDLVLDRSHLGFVGELSNTQICKLRKKSSEFIATTFQNALNDKFVEVGLNGVEVTVEEKDDDPRIIYINYPSLTEPSEYLPDRIQLEIGSRSLKDPNSPRNIETFVSQYYKDNPFADNPIEIPMITPERTFIEKIFLLHEEFQRPRDKIRVDRMSRHLYDIEKIMNSEYAGKALRDKMLFNTIKEHREKYNNMKGVDYTKHTYQDISIIPPKDVFPLWEKDYKSMRDNMIYGESLPFNELISRISELETRIHNIPI